MQTLLFEMKPRDGHEKQYFSHVNSLRPILLQQQGLLFVERYKSTTRPDVILSHSLWRDEASMARWRSNKDHQHSQHAGRYKHFEDYRIRISQALYCYSEKDDNNSWAVDVSQAEPTETNNRFVTIIRSRAAPNIACEETYKSVTDANSFLSTTKFSTYEAGLQHCLNAQIETGTLSAVFAQVSRDYGMHDRAEAPPSLNT